MTGEKKTIILYACNKQKCKECIPNCNFTDDIEFARDFDIIDDTDEQKIIVQMPQRRVGL